MTRPAISNLLGHDILKAWGLDERSTTRFTVEFEGNKAVYVTLHQEVREADGEGFREIMTQYRLLRVEDVARLLALEQKAST